MISINARIIEDIYLSDQVNIDSIIASKKQKLFDVLNSFFTISREYFIGIDFNQDESNYLNYLLSNFEKIIRANNSELEQFEKVFDGIIPGSQMKSRSYTMFRNELIKLLGYKELRDSFYPEYFEKIGIKSCVYCNSQLALTVRKVNGTKSAKFQVDHYYSKSEFPAFSISFYNLYPVCGPCNNSKSNNRVKFVLYSDSYRDLKTSKFKFELDKRSVLKYRVNGVNAELLIKFHEPVDANFKATFAIEGIYETQKDIAEELVLKSMIYNKSYTDSLRNGLKNLYKDKAPMLERLLVGNYTDENDIHKRPMAKFTQDIAKQLKLI